MLSVVNQNTNTIKSRRPRLFGNAIFIDNKNEALSLENLLIPIESTYTSITSSASDHRQSTKVHKPNLIWSTLRETNSVFPTVLRLIRKSRLKGTDIVRQEPRWYVTEALMPLYREMLSYSDADDGKVSPDPERNVLRSKSIALIREEDIRILGKDVDVSIGDQELQQILDMKAVYSLMTERGLDLQESRAKLFGNTAQRSSGHPLMYQQNFESVMWRLRQSVFMETEHPVGAVIDNPYSYGPQKRAI